MNLHRYIYIYLFFTLTDSTKNAIGKLIPWKLLAVQNYNVLLLLRKRLASSEKRLQKNLRCGTNKMNVCLHQCLHDVVE